MTLESDTSFVLRYGAIIGVLIVTAGAIMHLFDIGNSVTVMTAGIAVIVFTPFAGVIASFVTLSINKEKRYAAAAFSLIAIILAGMLIAFWLQNNV